MIGIVASLLGSKTGRLAVLIGLAVISTGLVLWRVFAAGKSAAKTEQLRASVDTLRQRIQTDDEIARMSPDARRDRLREHWSR